MTTEPRENDNNPSKHENAESPETTSDCNPGCACGQLAGKSNTKLKIAVFLVVVVAVCGILLYKITSAKQNTCNTGTSGFSNTFGAKSKGAVLNSAGQQGGSGASLSAIADLNTLAAKLDTVFLIIPSNSNAPSTKETGTVLASVERTLNAKGLSTGIFTLRTASPDYHDIAAKVTPPGIAVLSKGGGIGFVSGGLSETNLMQAYVTSTRSGGCGPGGCPSPDGGKAAVQGK